MHGKERITWEKTKGRHTKGCCEFGEVWIRQDREEKVTGMYTIFNGQTQKWVPEDEIEECLEGAKLKMEEVVLQVRACLLSI